MKTITITIVSSKGDILEHTRRTDTTENLWDYLMSLIPDKKYYRNGFFEDSLNSNSEHSGVMRYIEGSSVFFKHIIGE